MTVNEKEIVEAKSLLANMRKGEQKTDLTDKQSDLLTRYNEYHKVQLYSKKRLGRSLPVDEFELGGIEMTNEYGAKVNGFARSALRERIESDIEYAKANKLKSLVFKGPEKAESIEAKAQKVADKQTRADARAVKTKAKEAADKVKDKARDERKAKKLAKLKAAKEEYDKMTAKK